MRSYIKYHLVLVLGACNALIGRTRGRAFTVLFNLKALMRGSPARVVWDGRQYLMRDRSVADCEYCFRHERQGNMAYEKGFAHRARTLGAAYFLSQIDFNDGDVVLDCGANVGDLLLWFKQQKLAVQYVGFEPSPQEFACLERNVAPAPVNNIGLWKTDGELVFYVSSQGADSSLIEPPSYDEKLTVKTRRLAEFVDSPVKLLKLEAEGAEPEILEGLGEQLAFVRYISADLGFERGVQAESTVVPVVNYLLARDFELVAMGHDRICALFKNKKPRG